MTRPLSPLSLCGAGAVYLYKWSVYEKTAFCPGWRVAAAGQRQPLCRGRAGPDVASVCGRGHGAGGIPAPVIGGVLFAVLTCGACGFGMGATPNTMVNRQALCDRYEPSGNNAS